MRNRIIKIMEELFEESINQLNDSQIIPENLGNWDSLSHLALITSFEEEFNIEFDIEDIPLMYKGINYIFDVFNKHGVK